MKKPILLLVIFIGFISCEDVIDVNLPKAEPRLVIDASINWFKGTLGNEQEIKLTLSAPFFNTNIPPANNAKVQITDAQNTIYNFIEDATTGVYKNTNFKPVIHETYRLTVIYNDETYTAEETLKPVNSINRIEQNKGGGFSGEDIEIKSYFEDPISEENFYLIEFINDITNIPSIDFFSDEFINGNEIFAYYSDEDLSAGNEVNIKIHGVSERFYEFVFILSQQAESEGPFQTQPATVKGNCINTTTSENFPLGYFRLSEVDQFIYVIQ